MPPTVFELETLLILRKENRDGKGGWGVGLWTVVLWMKKERHIRLAWEVLKGTTINVSWECSAWMHLITSALGSTWTLSFLVYPGEESCFSH